MKNWYLVLSIPRGILGTDTLSLGRQHSLPVTVTMIQSPALTMPLQHFLGKIAGGGAGPIKPQEASQEVQTP